MSNPVGERRGLAGAGAGGDQQCRRFGIAVDAVFDSAALFRVEVVQMPPAIDRLLLTLRQCLRGAVDTPPGRGTIK